MNQVNDCRLPRLHLASCTERSRRSWEVPKIPEARKSVRGSPLGNTCQTPEKQSRKETRAGTRPHVKSTLASGTRFSTLAAFSGETDDLLLDKLQGAPHSCAEYGPMTWVVWKQADTRTTLLNLEHDKMQTGRVCHKRRWQNGTS
jgi:hypothetical protein